MEEQLLAASGNLLSYSYFEVLGNIALAIVLGVIISSTYRYTHKGLSYSQSFTQTILFVCVIVAIVMMVIGGSLSRAFALVGALSIIRFRTVIKDTKDTSFVFSALAIGMAAGTSNYFLALVATAFLTLLSLILYRTNYGALYKSEFILRFSFDQTEDSSSYVSLIDKMSKQSNLLHMEPSGDSKTLKLTYDIILKDGGDAKAFASDMGQLNGTSEVVLISAKNDIDY